MENVITIKELRKFIQDNRSQLDKDSTILITKGDKFGFVTHQGYLNLTGAYDWVTQDGQTIEGGYGDALSIWCQPNLGKIIYGEKSDNITRDHEDFFSNFMFDSKDSVPCNFERFEKELNRMIENENAIVTTLMNQGENTFGLIEGMKITDDVKLKYTDSYGHETEKSPKIPMLILEMGMGFTQKYNPNKNTNESLNHLKRFNDFK